MRGRPKETTLHFYKEALLRVLVYIQQHLDQPLALEELARIARLSPYHFHHVFTGMLNESLASHIRRLRLERAASRLKLTNGAIVQVALDAGYETHEAFSRAFRKNFGLSPTTFRKRNSVVAQIEAQSGVHYHARHRVRNFHTAQTQKKTLSVMLKSLKPMRVAFLRSVGPYNQVGIAWDHLLMFLGKEGRLDGRVHFIGICHDDPAVTRADKIRYDACVTVDRDYRPAGEIGTQIIPGGDYAVMTHFGGYDQLGESYAQLLGQWLPRSGRRLRTEPCFEVYFNSPENTEPEELVTDIHAPLESK